MFEALHVRELAMSNVSVVSSPALLPAENATCKTASPDDATWHWVASVVNVHVEELILKARCAFAGDTQHVKSTAQSPLRAAAIAASAFVARVAAARQPQGGMGNAIPAAHSQSKR
mmetsp:Transcript_55795/g.155550  ORF Transcript_55795/g.155550 Transcript_55795/m.155550 type:complete len:116 (-) Transcript_55795:46-393(-)